MLTWRGIFSNDLHRTILEPSPVTTCLQVVAVHRATIRTKPSFLWTVR